MVFPTSLWPRRVGIRPKSLDAVTFPAGERETAPFNGVSLPQGLIVRAIGDNVLRSYTVPEMQG